MALFGKKLYMKNTAGTQQSANIYSTTGEVGSAYTHLVVDGTTGYVRLVATNSAFATSGRVTETSGTTYAIGRVGTVAYGYGLYGSSGVFTVPSNVYILRVTCVGGGAGSVTGFHAGYAVYCDTTYEHYFGVTGGTSSFGPISASGGSDPHVNIYCYRTVNEVGNEYKHITVNSATISYGYHNGGYYYGSTDYHSGAPATPIVNIYGTTIGSYGYGGGCDENNRDRVNFTGASGNRAIGYMSVTPGQQIGFTVGIRGKVWHRGTLDYTAHSSSHGYGWDIGSDGAILVEWGGSIQ